MAVPVMEFAGLKEGLFLPFLNFDNTARSLFPLMKTIANLLLF